MDLDEFICSFSLSPLTIRLTAIVFLLLFVYTPVEEPNSDQTWTTEMPLHPRNLQTQDPTEDTFIRGGQASRSRLSLVWVLCVLLILSFGIRGYTLLQERLKQKQ
ncbi:myelin-oligodendrocyte glycoprotein-like isoform X2 [Scomber scombrus]|uniref:Myelin-oligodendrocyte glycoprotein-like isoform X2 n=1 Tax=Scomber scombrus TaxID=13677 RepID=A0AAV1PPY4_SCOSC